MFYFFNYVKLRISFTIRIKYIHDNNECEKFLQASRDVIQKNTITEPY